MSQRSIKKNKKKETMSVSFDFSIFITADVRLFPLISTKNMLGFTWVHDI